MGESKLTDKQLKYATDIAYLDLEKVNRKENLSISEILNLELDNKGNAKNLEDQREKFNSYKDTLGANISIDKVKELEDGSLNWKRAYTYNDNEDGGTGFYGVVIDTGDEIIVSFRGSEGFDEYKNIRQDWVGADAGLISGELTDQQKEVNKFIDELIELGYFDGSKPVTFAGHSLGGNLAQHGTFYAAQKGVVDKITRTISYDGPGFSQEYLENQKAYIEEATKVVQMDHVEQSLVGAMLTQPDGVNNIYAKLKEGVKGFDQHSTSNVIYSDGKVESIENRRTDLKLIQQLTQGLDRLIPSFSPKILVGAVTILVNTASIIKEKLTNSDGSLNLAGKLVAGGIAVAIVGFLMSGGIITSISLLAGIIGRVLLFTVSVIVFEYVHDFIDGVEAFMTKVITETIPELVESVVTEVAKFSMKIAANIEQFKNTVLGEVAKFISDIIKFTKGSIAVATPYINLNTNSLRSYADRLAKVKSRLAELDSDMTSLIFTESLPAVISAIRANNFPSQRKIQKCINYLDGTAEAFEKAEKNILSQV